MEDFPKDNFIPVGGTLTQEDDFFNIEVPLHPFPLDGETVSTSFRLEFIDFGTDDVQKLANKTFNFPINPEEGYIDGSIYLRHAHNPVDVTEITFGAYDGTILEVTLTMQVAFEFEGSGFKNTGLLLTTLLTVARSSTA